jgi:WD40 repeat protein
LVSAVAFHPDGTTLATTSHDRTIRLWDPATGRELHQLTGHQGLVSAVAFHPDGTTLATTSHDRTIRLWDVASASPAATIRPLRGTGWAVLTPDGGYKTSDGDLRSVLWWVVKRRRFDIGELEGIAGVHRLAPTERISGLSGLSRDGAHNEPAPRAWRRTFLAGRRRS